MSQIKQQTKTKTKRDLSNVTTSSTEPNTEPSPKRRKIDLNANTNNNKNNNNNKDTKKWKCSQCTLLNEATASKCIICNIPNSSQRNNLSRNNSISSINSASWGDDEDIDIDNNNNNIINNNKINTNTNRKPKQIVNIKPIKQKTLNGLEYTECWLCTNCFAMNRLLDTISKHNYSCAFCNLATYTPKTEIIKSFEWDQQPVNNNNNNNNTLLPTNQMLNNNNKNINKKNLLEEYEGKKRSKYNTKGLNNKEGDVLIMGLIHQNNVKQLHSIKLIPEDIIRLTLLFHGEFEYDGWDTFTNCNDFEIDNGLTTVCRTDKDKNLWRNCFGMRQVKNINIENENNYNNNNNNNKNKARNWNKYKNIRNVILNSDIKNVRYEWILKCVKRINKDWEDEPVDSVIIGIIEAKGIQDNMGSQFSTYTDGWGLCGDGTKVNDGKYEKFNSGFCHMSSINICLEWNNLNYNQNKSICQVLFDGKIAYQLNPNKAYKLAMAMNSREYQLEWVSFAKYNHIKNDNKS